MGNLPTWDDPVKLQSAIDRYFSAPENQTNPTVCGLALALDFCSRKSLYEYTDKPDLGCIVKQALMRVENAMEKRCGENVQATGAIFRLKNHGWKDSNDLNIGGQSDNPFNVKVVFNDKKE